MVTLKEYEAYLKVKRFIDGHDEAEIILRLIGDNKYVDCAHWNRCMRIVRRKGGVKEFRITWL